MDVAERIYAAIFIFGLVGTTLSNRNIEELDRINVNALQHTCPQEDTKGHCYPYWNWNELPLKCYKDSSDIKMTFEEAHNFCRYPSKECHKYEIDFGQGLAKVEELAYFTYGTTLKKSLCNDPGPFRVDTVRHNAGEWRPAGGSINMTYFVGFPEFNCFDGKPGDTLIWYPNEQRLEIVDKMAKYPALCIAPKLDMNACVGYPTHECDFVGDCVDGVCVCSDPTDDCPVACPIEFPIAYKDGKKCCTNQFEHNTKADTCSGGPISFESSCCRGGGTFGVNCDPDDKIVDICRTIPGYLYLEPLTP